MFTDDALKKLATPRSVSTEPPSTLNANDPINPTISPSEHYSQVFTRATGSWPAIMTYSAACTGWAAFNLLSHLAVDPYPFTFLNFILSASAALSAPVILMSQNTDRKCDQKKIAETQREELQHVSNLLNDLDQLPSPLPSIVLVSNQLRTLRVRAKETCGSAEINDSLGFAESLTKGLGKFFGSWAFLGTMSSAISAWIVGNYIVGMLDLSPIDPPPYLFLNLALSFISAFSAPVVLMSQQYEDQLTKKRAEIFTELANKRAELERLVRRKLLELN